MECFSTQEAYRLNKGRMNKIYPICRVADGMFETVIRRNTMNDNGNNVGDKTEEVELFMRKKPSLLADTVRYADWNGLFYTFYPLDLLTESVRMCRTVMYHRESGLPDILPLIPMNTPNDEFVSIARESLGSDTLEDCWRIVFHPSASPVNTSGQIIVETEAYVMSLCSGLRMNYLTCDIPMSQWHSIETWGNGGWQSSSLLGDLANRAIRRLVDQETMHRTEIRKILSRKDDDISSLRSSIQLAEQKYRAEIELYQKDLAISQSQSALVQSQNGDLVQKMERLKDEDWCLKEMMELQHQILELQKQVENEQLNKLVMDEATKAALREGENYKRHDKYLQDILRHNAIQFNETIGHNPDNPKKAA
jgi:hypothetical protein